MNRFALPHALAFSLSLALLAGLSSCQSTHTQPYDSSSDSQNDDDSRSYPQRAEPTASPRMDSGMQGRCQELNSEAHQLMADMNSQDAALADELRTMNSSSESEKVGVLASIVTQLVEQRATLDVRMERLHQSMTQHMLQHMQAGGTSSGQCPMMQSAAAPVEARTSRS